MFIIDKKKDWKHLKITNDSNNLLTLFSTHSMMTLGNFLLNQRKNAGTPIVIFGVRKNHENISCPEMYTQEMKASLLMVYLAYDNSDNRLTHHSHYQQFTMATWPKIVSLSVKIRFILFRSKYCVVARVNIN